jgi:hypothetical protein
MFMSGIWYLLGSYCWAKVYTFVKIDTLNILNHYFNKILTVNISYGFFLKIYFSLLVLNIENEIEIYLQYTLIKHILLLLRVLLYIHSFSNCSISTSKFSEAMVEWGFGKINWNRKGKKKWERTLDYNFYIKNY